MPQIRQVVSEALQSTVRRLLPSQQGFTEDLMATNVITPVIDLTPSAEGSALPVDLARALAFGSQTAFDIVNTSTVIANTAGFHRLIGTVSITSSAATQVDGRFDMSDGLSTKSVWQAGTITNGQFPAFSVPFDFVVFLDSGDSITGVSTGGEVIIAGSVRQVADLNGDIVNPSGFVQQ